MSKGSPSRGRGGTGMAGAEEFQSLSDTVTWLKDMMDKIRKQIGLPLIEVQRSKSSDSEEEEP